MFGLEKYCPVCGVKVEKRDMIRFGKRFCSEEHAEQYVERVQHERQTVEREGSRGGCC